MARKTLTILFCWLILTGADQLPPSLGRDPKQVAAFRKVDACPATKKTTGACPGWVVDHVVPLCWGGADSPLNMAWQEAKMSYKKDVFEREACAMKKKAEAKQ
jgi:hypothetical protein